MQRRILFVDDEPNVLQSLQRMLRGERAVWAMDFVESVDEAEALLLTHEYDAVVLDVSMPAKNGFVLLNDIRRANRTRHVPVVILTGHTESDLKRRALDMGATDLLNKPVDAEDLRARLRNVIRLKDYQDQLLNNNATLEQRVRTRTADLEDSRLDIIWRLGKAAELRDEATGWHVVRVGCYCRTIAETMGADPEFVKLLFLASPLHDLGKIGVPDAVLLKRQSLDESERKMMQRHCLIGAQILQEDAKIATVFRKWLGQLGEKGGRRRVNPMLSLASTIALYHHERWDGGGYPAGLAGHDIPLAARITAVADVYDALCSARPYKPAMSENEALEIMRGENGRHFDPDVFAAFNKSIREISAIRNELVDESGLLIPTGYGI